LDKQILVVVQVKFGGGTIRINIFPDQTLSVPKLDVELFFFFGRINMYINFVARTDLVIYSPYIAFSTDASPKFCGV
jgi:hypothetical protein